MHRADVLNTKLTPPRLQRRVLPRPALIAKLREAADYRLTLVQAATGYGKTTTLAGLGVAGSQLFWYSVGEADADPHLFLSYLIAAFQIQLPGFSDSPLAILRESGSEGVQATWLRTIDALINTLAQSLPEPSILVIDDYHFVASSAEIDALTRRFIAHAPPELHVILAMRHPLSWPELIRWRARGEVLEINRETLAFQPAEIEALFHTTYGIPLVPDDIAVLADKTEGWPIALQLVWQGLRMSTARSAAEVLVQSPTSLAALLEYLISDVLDRQPPEVVTFLYQTAVLRELTPSACDAVRDRADDAVSGEKQDRDCAQSATRDAQRMLEYLHDHDLFVVALGAGHYRYHYLFHDFLRQQAASDSAGLRERHCRAAAFFQTQRDDDEAIYHWLAAWEYEAAAGMIERASETALHQGRLDTVAQWIDMLPADALVTRPRLQATLGDICRLHSRFDEALAWYAQAEQSWRACGDSAGLSRALRGQALVYLDTVRPVEAESLLMEALRLTDGTADLTIRARLLELLAENKLNMGKPGEAESLRSEARALLVEEPGEDVLSVRVKLRTGQIDEAQRILEGWAEEERKDVARGHLHPPRSHRETVLILALIHTFRGRGEQAYALAHDGIALGERLDSPFVTAVAHVRLGHAWQLRYRQSWPPESAHAFDEAIRCYQSAIVLGDRLAVRRMRAEAMWGLTRAYGFLGDLDAAQRSAAEGVEIGRWAGDAWIVGLNELALGASYVLAGQSAKAIDILTRVLSAFRDCGDSLGRAATRLWLSLAYYDLGQSERFAACVEDALALCESRGYAFLWTAQTLLGPPDPHYAIPVLIAARARRLRPTYVAQLLAELGVPEIQLHPGYRLRVQTLGAFRVWRGESEVSEWQRDKARQLFQVLLTERRSALQREEIVERLWPQLAAAAASRDFKVALNALYKALEPARVPDAPSAYVVREGACYQLRSEADIWLDAAVFEQECAAGLRLIERGAPDRAIERLQAALQLYGGDYLPDMLYEDWVSAERERLLSLYLRAADALAGALVARGHYDKAIAVCQGILARDSCWERAYRLMMQAHLRQGNRPQALRVYQRCVGALRDELGVEPDPATVTLYQRIAQESPGEKSS